MKTFRSEVFNGREVISGSDSTYVLHEVINSVLDRYGDWRVVDGVLHNDSHGGGIHIHPISGDGRHVCGLSPGELLRTVTNDAHRVRGEDVLVGHPQDRVKLLLPPEELPDPPIDWEKVADTASARADRFEKALRAIRAEGRQAACCDAERIADIRSIAREALEDE